MRATLNKGAARMSVDYGRSSAWNLLAYDVHALHGKRALTLSIDLRPNLESKDARTRAEAQALAAGGLLQLHLLQFDDRAVLNRLDRMLFENEDLPAKWILHVRLDGICRFPVVPEFKEGRLWLWVSGAALEWRMPLSSP